MGDAGTDDFIPRPPEDYEDICKIAAVQFKAYRRYGGNPVWSDERMVSNSRYWTAVTLPTTEEYRYFLDHRLPWKKVPYWTSDVDYKAELDNLIKTTDKGLNTAKIRLAKAKKYFRGSPKFVYQKPLGYGGLGLALHYRFDNSQDIVIKLGLKHFESDTIREEERMTRKLLRAAHSIQVIDPPSIGVYVLDKYVPRPNYLDSSDEEEDSSGDESVTERRPAKKPRRDVPQEELVAKRERKAKQREAWDRDRAARTRTRKDFMLLEYAPGGSINSLIHKLKKATPEGQTTIIPNRVLWEIWLCLVRACVGMKYPPRKFHPSRPKPSAPENKQQDLIETVPPLSKRWRAKNIVHFDIDPSNIFIGNLEKPPGDIPPTAGKRKYDTAFSDREKTEHQLVPRFKLADFGLAREIKPHKINAYYFALRHQGKVDYLAPEQFCADWDWIPPDRTGAEVSEQDIAGNYGPHTNVWGMAMTMWNIITQLDAPKPPQPQVPEGIIVPPHVEGQPEPNIDAIIRAEIADPKISYCPLLMDGGFYNYIDVDLRRTIYECMYHNPTHRPRIEGLLAQARQKVKQTFPNEPDNAVQDWTNRFFFNAETETETETKDDKK
ncbi:kinase-like protein [Hypoxylon sp. FL0543]|nr:kinase-like protein [Hypoxylon sp. FL0543]